jgi:hypothetical protein
MFVISLIDVTDLEQDLLPAVYWKYMVYSLISAAQTGYLTIVADKGQVVWDERATTTESPVVTCLAPLSLHVTRVTVLNV